MTRSENILEIQDLHLTYTGREWVVHAIQNASLIVARGEAVGIAGESGSGKSTLARTALGLLPPETATIVSGRVIVNGIDATRFTTRQWGKLRGNPIAMVFQDPLSFLNPVVRVGEQIEESVKRHDPGVAATPRALALLDMVQLPATALRRYPHELSGGMRQRVMLAIALGCRPQLLVADEPTTALDVTTQAEILKLLAELRSELNMSMLLISHDLGVLRQSCDRTYIMYAGHTIETGATSDVLHRPKHPYTRGLIDASRMRRDDQGRFPTIGGDVPSLNTRFALCPFLSRCPCSVDECRSLMPQLTELAPSHRVRCFAAAKNHQEAEARHGLA